MPVHNFTQPQGTIVQFQFDARTLHGNLLGDPTERNVTVYLPRDYDRSDREYPLFVDLAGFTSSGTKRVAWTAFGESVPQRLDRLVAEGRMGPVVAVFPDGFTSLGGNQYVDSPVTGRWATFVADELIEQIEARFRVRHSPSNRAVYGKSSGGYGALVQALLHGERWGAVACHSGDMGFEWVYLRDFPGLLDALAHTNRDPVEFLERLAAQPKLSGSDFHNLMLIAMAASYDPDPSSPRGIRLPVDLTTCELDAEKWRNWLAWDPLRMVDRASCRASLAHVVARGGLFVDCGRRDQYFLHYGSRSFSRKLHAYGIDHTYEEFDDNHSAIDYRLDRSLPYLYARCSQG